MSADTDANSPPTTSSEQTPPAPVDWAAEDPDTPAAPDPTPPDTDNAAVEGDDANQQAADAAQRAQEAAEDDPIGDDPEPGDNDPPEFWSAERKALWDKVTDPEVRAAIKDHVQEVSRSTARKLEENAGKVRQAEESAKAALEAQQRDMQWWQENGPLIQQVIEGEFAGINWNELSAKDPAAWAQAKQAKEARENWLRGIMGRHQQAVEATQQRAKQAEQQARAAEHGKLAARFPQEFGTPERAQRTYDALSKYLATNGIPPERIQQVYEAPVVEIIRKAYKYDQLQARAKSVTTSAPPAVSAKVTPTRVVPGATRQGANPLNEAERQAMERLRSGARPTPEEAALLFR